MNERHRDRRAPGYSINSDRFNKENAETQIEGCFDYCDLCYGLLPTGSKHDITGGIVRDGEEEADEQNLEYSSGDLTILLSHPKADECIPTKEESKTNWQHESQCCLRSSQQ